VRVVPEFLAGTGRSVLAAADIHHVTFPTIARDAGPVVEESRR
jgi:hypothetical protein